MLLRKIVFLKSFSHKEEAPRKGRLLCGGARRIWRKGNGMKNEPAPGDTRCRLSIRLSVCPIHFRVINAAGQRGRMVIYKDIDHISIDGAAGIFSGIHMSVDDDL